MKQAVERGTLGLESFFLALYYLTRLNAKSCLHCALPACFYPSAALTLTPDERKTNLAAFGGSGLMRPKDDRSRHMHKYRALVARPEVPSTLKKDEIKPTLQFECKHLRESALGFLADSRNVKRK